MIAIAGLSRESSKNFLAYQAVRSLKIKIRRPCWYRAIVAKGNGIELSTPKMQSLRCFLDVVIQLAHINSHSQAKQYRYSWDGHCSLGIKRNVAMRYWDGEEVIHQDFLCTSLPCWVKDWNHNKIKCGNLGQQNLRLMRHNWEITLWKVLWSSLQQHFFFLFFSSIGRTI